MSAQNNLIDYVTPLNWEVYRENVARRTYEFPVSYSLPAVVIARATYDAAGMRPLPVNLQPTITLAGRLMTHTYANTRDLPQAFYQEILFDGRIVLAGNVTVGKRTAFLGAPENGTIIIQTAPNVTVAVPFSGDFATSLFRDQAQAAAVDSANSATASAASAVSSADSAATSTQQAGIATVQAANLSNAVASAGNSAATSTQQAGIATVQAANALNSANSAANSQQYVANATGNLVVFVSEDSQSVKLAFGSQVSIVDFATAPFPYVKLTI